MKKLLKKLLSTGELTVLNLDRSKGVYGGCQAYDQCGSGFDGSTSYDTSTSNDPSTTDDLQ